MSIMSLTIANEHFNILISVNFTTRNSIIPIFILLVLFL